ncbi:MAG TPA: hypothetical protein VKG86_04205 [Terracidiphilus sp.]|nr:hypothetical protein [Terracidiphilus sp.]
MTVLFIAGSNDGVALAADGLQTFVGEEACVKNGQKIWEGKTLHRDPVLYGCYNACTIQRGARTFSFPDFSDFALSTMDLDNYEDSSERFLADFANKVGNELQRFLMGYTDESSSVPLPTRIASIALAWYSGGNPFFGCVSFEHAGGIASWKMEFVRQDVHDAAAMVGGSETILSRGTAPIIGLQDAIAVAKKFAQDCVDNRFVVPDCSEFGGRVHVGVLTKSGFYWDAAP